MAGRVETDPSGTVPEPMGGQFLCHAEVEERLVEALRHWWRSDDRDARFGLGGRISSIWRQVLPGEHLADLIDARGAELETPEPRALPLSRGDMQRRDEASEWLLLVPAADRRLVILGLSWLARGEKRIPWLKVARRMRTIGAEGLRKRYSRAITSVCNQLNAAEKLTNCLSR